MLIMDEDKDTTKEICVESVAELFEAVKKRNPDPLEQMRILHIMALVRMSLIAGAIAGIDKAKPATHPRKLANIVHSQVMEWCEAMTTVFGDKEFGESVIKSVILNLEAGIKNGTVSHMDEEDPSLYRN